MKKSIEKAFDEQIEKLRKNEARIDTNIMDKDEFQEYMTELQIERVEARFRECWEASRMLFTNEGAKRYITDLLNRIE